MKGYKHTELGWIPEEWEVNTGREISNRITKGSSPNWQGFKYKNEGILFVTSENVREGYLDISDPKFLPEEFNHKQRNSILKKGDILINIVGASIGRSCIFNQDIEANVNQAVCVFSPKETVYGEYIAIYLGLPVSINRLLNTQSASARPNLTLEDIRDFKFVVPTFKEQKKISQIINSWNKSIETLVHLIAAKQQLKKGLMQQLLNPSNHWEKCYLGDLAKIGTGGKDNQNKVENGKYPFFVRSQTVERIDSYSYDGEAILIPGEGGIGEIIHYIKGKFDFHQRVYKISDFSSTVNGKYLFYFLQLNFKKAAAQDSVKATVDSLRLPTFLKMEIWLPELYEQEKIAGCLNFCDMEIKFLNDKLALFRTQKQGLMQHLLTGKKRVKV